MSRAEIIKSLKKKNKKLIRSDLEVILDTFTQSLTNALRNNQEIHLRGFGRFYRKKLKANANLRNPRTNQLIFRPERDKVRFKASKKLNKLINE